MKCLSILRYLTDHLEDLPLGVTSRMVCTNDVPEMLARCIATRPWVRRGRGRAPDRVFQVGRRWLLQLLLLLLL